MGGEREKAEKAPSRRMLGEELDAARLAEEPAERDRRYVGEQVPEFDWQKDRGVAPLREEILSLVQPSAAEFEDEDDIVSQIAKANPKVAQGIDAMIQRAIPLQAGLPPLLPDATPDQIHQHRAAAHYLEGIRSGALANALKVRVLAAALKSSCAEPAKLRQRVADAARANKPEAGYVKSGKPAAGVATAAVPTGQDYETARNPWLK